MYRWEDFQALYGVFAQSPGSAIYASVFNDPEIVDELAGLKEPDGPTPAPPLFRWSPIMGKLADIEDQLNIANFRGEAKLSKRPVYPHLRERKRRKMQHQTDRIAESQARNSVRD
ncbi:hypothetical protein [Mycobacteroides immunogenum]|uniref:Uncharacterized protein n=1 Tax=Mycobacteroides immunogenum TaxID=83262 RepID=A0A7V8LRJ6_9MYCO|nr:hypothetical protein [Mycobacteroides immunogenum]KPG13742.1 hypothetical protein AN909_05700 [Mycobacteroides immunogenum]KPG14268.1 hypothetical protein AN908_06700 [Mycobacteroides immunogenum]KPG14344.1 hypothetical protein AN908_07210 [Mycobacteroides immunogenum]KPG17456.1 hypothetical protein AN910_04925 [Mycobacteroides immunogenum]KPG23960.1 hypothetical protein AN911_00230 [Mycobacteroides immunogenum]